MSGTYQVGAGVLAAMQQDGTTPASDEVYIHGTRAEAQWSETMGANGFIYRWLPATGIIYRYDGAEWRDGAERPLAWGARVSPEFCHKVRQISADLECSCDHLMAAMAFETGETFSPSVPNRASGATGLIQFLPSTAKLLGTTVQALAQMTAEQQLDYVARYFAPYKHRLLTLEDVYMAILWPKAVGKANGFALFERGTREYDQNSGLDRNGDGVVTKEEAASIVAERLRRGRQPENVR